MYLAQSKVETLRSQSVKEQLQAEQLRAQLDAEVLALKLPATSDVNFENMHLFTCLKEKAHTRTVMVTAVAETRMHTASCYASPDCSTGQCGPF